jgi:transaldolase
MLGVGAGTDLAAEIREFVRADFRPHFGLRTGEFPSHPLWRRLRELGTELWLDTGNIDEAGPLWTREFSALTTNNTLLNKEIQTGRYDDLIRRAARMLDARGRLSPRERTLELAFILNAYHGLRLVERFDAYVSVEEHTDLAHEVDAAVDCARRYHAVCPERFIVKIPFTPAGVLATRRLAAAGVPVNHTLGFSARQNYVAARIGRPRYVNVFMGRLNQFAADNGLGDGAWVGERAALASQAVVRALRRRHGVPTMQIGASLREPSQVRDLAGMDVMTVPPKTAGGFLGLGLEPAALADQAGKAYEPRWAASVDPEAIRFETLWGVDHGLIDAVEALEQENVDAFAPDDLIEFLARRGCGDLMVRWTPGQVAASAAEGKIPRLAHWREDLAAKAIGLDALMNLAGLNSFAADQKAMDEHVAAVLKER